MSELSSIWKSAVIFREDFLSRPGWLYGIWQKSTPGLPASTRPPYSNLHRALPPGSCPVVDHVGPSLHHVAALVSVLGFVIDSANSALLVREAFLDPV